MYYNLQSKRLLTYITRLYRPGVGRPQLLCAVLPSPSETVNLVNNTGKRVDLAKDYFPSNRI